MPLQMPFLNQLQPNPWAFSLLVPVILSLYVAHEAWRPQFGVRGKVFSLSMLPVILWSAAYGFELASTDFEVMKMWLRIEYLAIPFVTPFMLLVIFQIVNNDFGFQRKKIIAIFIIPVITMVLSITNDYHHYFYTDIVLQNDGEFPTLRLFFGPWYYVHVTYSYLLVLMGLVILFRKIIYFKSFFLFQRISMLLAVIIPIISFTVYFFGWMPVKNVDPTPFAFSLTGLALSVGILKYRILNLAPIARELMFRSMNDGIIVTDNKQRLIDANPAGGLLFSWEFIPQAEHLSEVWKDHPVLLSFISQTGLEAVEFQTTLLSQNLVFHVTKSAIRNKQGKNIGMMFVFHDVTIRTHLLQQVEANEKALATLNLEKDKLFTVIAHDLRGPIHAFVDLTSLFTDESYNLSRDEMIEMARSMNKSAQSIQGLLENLLQWAQLQKNAVIVEKETLNLEEIVNQSVRVLSEMFSRKEILVETEIDSRIIVFCDEKMCLSVFRNLLSNALKFTPRKGKVKIKAIELPDRMVEISIIDTGIGMNQAMLGRLFQLDKGIGRPGTEGEVSSGLGLLLCCEFVERQGGTMHVESVEKQGSTFSFTLPMA